MKKLFLILLLVLAMVTSSISAVLSNANQSTEDLWAEKIAYESERSIGVGERENQWDIYYELSWQFIPYTKAGKDLVYEIKTEEFAGEYPYPPYLYVLRYAQDSVLYSQELIDIYHESLIVPTDDRPGVCNTRKMLQSLGITEEDMRNAYERMKNEPESIREILSCLNNEEFEGYLASIEQRLSIMEKYPTPDFVISALFLENETEAQYLLSKTGAVYVPELGYALFTDMLIGGTSAEEIVQHDLTTKGFGYYLKNLRKLIEGGWYSGIHFDSDGRTAMEKLEYLESAREAQLKAAQTGDGAVSALWVVALAVPALAAVILVKRKRRI